jgi:hypothetical protein
LQGFRRFQPDRENESRIEKMKTMSDWRRRCPRDYTAIDGSQITSARGIDDPSGAESPPCSRDVISSRRPVAPQSALLRANAGPQAIDSVTRVSSRVDLFEAEFKGTGVGLPYIEHQVSASDAASR